MPVEIRELTIKVTVGKDAPAGGGNASGGPAAAAVDIDLIIEKVLRALEQKQQR